MSPAAMAYLLRNCGGGWGAVQGCRLILSSSTYSCTVTRLSTHCGDRLLRRFDTLFTTHSSSKAPPPAAVTCTGHAMSTKKMDWKARKMQYLVSATAHGPVVAELEQPAPVPAVLRQGTTGQNARLAWLERGRKWSTSVCHHVDEKDPHR
jgi:hypothetical protein